MSGTEQDILIAHLGRSEQRALQRWLSDAVRWDVAVDDLESIGRCYDDFVARVLATPPAERKDPTAVCTMIGMALGEHLVRNSRLEWRVVTDAQGTDLAVATPEENGILYPADPVMDMWAQQQVGWLPAWARELLSAIQP